MIEIPVHYHDYELITVPSDGQAINSEITIIWLAIDVAEACATTRQIGCCCQSHGPPHWYAVRVWELRAVLMACTVCSLY